MAFGSLALQFEGGTTHDPAAEHLAEEMAFMANAPGGGVTPSNIITHLAAPRYRNLSEAMASSGLAEREGIGVDRMVRVMCGDGKHVEFPQLRTGFSAFG